MSGKKNILFVDDEQHVLDGLRRSLRNLRSDWNMIFVSNGEVALKTLRANPFDALVTDLEMPGIGGLELVRTLREKGWPHAIIVLTGRGSESAAVAAMKSGAQEYLVKGSTTPDLVEFAVKRAMDTVAQIAAQEYRNSYVQRISETLAEQNIELDLLSRTDSLTMLFNRRTWEECITLEHERSQRFAHTYSVIMIDVDNFKALNDSQGHAMGDEVLRQVALCVRVTLRATDVAGRYGGEEFVVLLPETPLDGALTVAERIRSSLWDANIPHDASETAERVTISLGVASGLTQSWEDLVKAADQALYASKKNGRNMVTGTALLQVQLGTGKCNPIVPRSGAA